MEIFVFGSNLAGIHGAGSAKHARNHFGAELGVGKGRTGNAYAIPTKSARFNVLPLKEIAGYVSEFIDYAIANPDLTFTVVKVGCGLTGYSEDQISPMFSVAPKNCNLPDGWRKESFNSLDLHLHLGEIKNNEEYKKWQQALGEGRYIPRKRLQ